MKELQKHLHRPYTATCNVVAGNALQTANIIELFSNPTCIAYEHVVASCRVSHRHASCKLDSAREAKPPVIVD